MKNTLTKKNTLPQGEADNPFTEKLDFPIFDDLSEMITLDGEPLRVELRRVQDPATGIVEDYERKVLGDDKLVGIIGENQLPKEGNNFRMSYHKFNGMQDFGTVESGEPVSKVQMNDSYFYFHTVEGDWRLEILDKGN